MTRYTPDCCDRLCAMIIPCSYIVCHLRIGSYLCSTRTVRVPPTGPRAHECSAASSVLRPVQSVPRLVGALVHRRHRCVSSSLAGDRSGARHLRGNRSGAIPIRCVHPSLHVCQLHLLFCFFSSQCICACRLALISPTESTSVYSYGASVGF